MTTNAKSQPQPKQQAVPKQQSPPKPQAVPKQQPPPKLQPPVPPKQQQLQQPPPKQQSQPNVQAAPKQQQPPPPKPQPVPPKQQQQAPPQQQSQPNVQAALKQQQQQPAPKQQQQASPQQQQRKSYASVLQQPPPQPQHSQQQPQPHAVPHSQPESKVHTPVVHARGQASTSDLPQPHCNEHKLQCLFGTTFVCYTNTDCPSIHRMHEISAVMEPVPNRPNVRSCAWDVADGPCTPEEQMSFKTASIRPKQELEDSQSKQSMQLHAYYAPQQQVPPQQQQQPVAHSQPALPFLQELKQKTPVVQPQGYAYATAPAPKPALPYMQELKHQTPVVEAQRALPQHQALNPQTPVAPAEEPIYSWVKNLATAYKSTRHLMKPQNQLQPPPPHSAHQDNYRDTLDIDQLYSGAYEKGAVYDDRAMMTPSHDVPWMHDVNVAILVCLLVAVCGAICSVIGCCIGMLTGFVAPLMSKYMLTHKLINDRDMDMHEDGEYLFHARHDDDDDADSDEHEHVQHHV